MSIDKLNRTKNIFGTIILSLNIFLLLFSIWGFPAYRAMEGLENLVLVDYVRQATFIIDIFAGIFMVSHFKVSGFCLLISSATFFVCRLFYPYENSLNGAIFLSFFAVICALDVLVWLMIYFSERKLTQRIKVTPVQSPS